MGRIAPVSTVLAFGLVVSGCANLTSIWRSTDLTHGDANAQGIAIHLDAKQRLAISKGFGVVCAEPSPDALSAIAASFSGGVAVPNQGSASLAQALNESAASIGLRTQSITLMRDALYRICEAYYGRALNGPQVMSLIARTQDLTAGVLAIEQLTGAVAARQVALTGAAQAAASSNLAFVGDVLDALRKKETQQNQAVEDATKERDATKKAADDKKNELDAEKAKATPDQVVVDRLTGEWNALTKALEIKQRNLEIAQKAAEQTKVDRQVVEKNHSSALTQASASAQGDARFADAGGAVKLSEQSVEHVSAAVTEIVKTVVNRIYMDDGCFALISDNIPQRMSTGDQTLYTKRIDFCIKLIETMFARSSGDKGPRIEQIEKQAESQRSPMVKK